MRRNGDPTALLHRLLDRHERRTDAGRRIIEKPAQAFATPAVRDTLVEGLKSAEATGGVVLEFDRDAPHLVARVILKDADKLYAFVGRTPRGVVTETAAGVLAMLPLKTPVAEMLRSDFVGAWRQGKRWLGVAPTDMGAASDLLAAADAIFIDIGEDLPIRTRSARVLGDSKALERAMTPLLGYLKHVGVLDVGLSRDEALAHLGLSKYPQPVLVAGPLQIDGADLGSWPYVGLPPDLVAGVTPSQPIRSILTIENLESFNRHVRSCRLNGDVVVYTGGFPSRPILTLLRALTEGESHGVRHWGDIDPGGIRIGRFLETSLTVQVTPHLMTSALAKASGRPPSREPVDLHLPETSAFLELSTYLAQPEALWLEQEVIDPVPTGAL